MTGSICKHFTGEINTTFCGPTIPWEGIIRDFGRIGGIRSLRVFSDPSAINRFRVRLTIPFPSA